MKGIERCGDCRYYSWKWHSCTRGANKDPDPQAPFFADCPLKDVQPVGLKMYVECVDGKPRKYRYGDETEAMALYIEGGYDTPEEAMRAWERRIPDGQSRQKTQR